jgi:amino acid transporter
VAGEDLSDEKLERELERLLEEVRVALPGVQILFAFLLAVPFANRFQDVTAVQTRVYFVSFVAALAASIFLIAPTSYHRLRFRKHDDPERMIRTANVFALVGLAFLAVALTAATFLVTDFVFSLGASIAVTSVMGALLLGVWYAIPLSRYLRD